MTEFKRVPSRAGQIIYGPINSRRIGTDIGINLLTQEGKTCNFNCLYCQYGETDNLIRNYRFIGEWVNPGEVLRALEEKLIFLLKNNWKLDAITFSGFGEPTLHPKFNLIVKKSKEIKDKYYPEAKLTLITNSTNLGKKDLLNSLVLFNQILAKLDTANQEIFLTINRPFNKNLKINKIIKNLSILSKKVEKLILQILLFEINDESSNSNTDLLELIKLSDAVCFIEPKEVQIYTIVRKAAVSCVEPTDNKKLLLLKNLIDKKCGDKVTSQIY